MPYADATLSELLKAGAGQQDAATMAFLEEAALKSAMEYLQRAYPWLHENVATKTNVGIPTPKRTKKMFGDNIKEEKDYPINIGYGDLTSNQLPQHSMYGVGRRGTPDVLFNLAVPDLMGLIGHEVGHKANVFPQIEQVLKQFPALTHRQKLALFASGYPSKAEGGTLPIEEIILRAIFNPGQMWGIEELGGEVIAPTAEQKEYIDLMEEIFKTGKYKPKKKGKKSEENK